MVDDYKRSSEILADKNQKFFWEKVKSENFPRSPKILLEIGGGIHYPVPELGKKNALLLDSQ